ncbi:MAG: hypothetical protein NTZ20_05215 [Candidatus Levybacteria bacterium]|nr:hypothetical protein [Candidatus Levybacteria bacterium]
MENINKKLIKRRTPYETDWLVAEITSYIMITLLAAWTTNIIYCIFTDKMLMLIASAILFPVGMIHGIMLWFIGLWNLICWIISLVIG